jgi:hypothetical protein
MNAERNFDPEILRPLTHIYEPDPRNTAYVTVDRESGGFRPLTIHDHYEAVSQISLNKMVPEDIVTQFETIKNLYLYAWFIYRFYPVAEHQAFACLELALRTRYEKDIPKEYYPRSEKPSIRPLLRYSIDKGDIKNEGFRKWHEAVEQRAHVRYGREKGEEMRSQKLNQIELNYAEVEITDVDRNIDYVKILLETLPATRNLYAHGTPLLKNTVLGTIELASEIINQIYPVK